MRERRKQTPIRLGVKDLEALATLRRAEGDFPSMAEIIRRLIHRAVERQGGGDVRPR